MTKYQLAKLISLAKNGTVESRKRMQKVVFLLQASGMQLADDFRLHHYGPYSREVATLLDDLSETGILEEDAQSFERGIQYTYSLSKSAKTAISALEKRASKSIKDQEAEFEQYKEKIHKLLQIDDLWLLELGSTMAYYRKKGMDWEEAVKSACEYKKYPEDSPKSLEALRLVREVVD